MGSTSPCLSAKGCGASALPACTPGAHGVTVATAFAQARSMPNKTARIEGVLQPQHKVCTIVTCDAGGCCNQCSALPAIADPNSTGSTIDIRSVGDSGV